MNSGFIRQRVYQFKLATYKFFPEFYKNHSGKSFYFYRDMKKLLVSIIAVFYLGTSVGATVNLHYCMGHFVNWDFSDKKDHACKKCGMEKSKKNGCCQDEYKLLQVDKNQKAENSYKLSQPPAVLVSTVYPVFQPVTHPSISEEQPVSNAPPRSEVPVHIRFCVFRI